ncbi:unnamed protein product [Pocillopora meandrina]|uniref:Ig-like domain-containing protein n=1 Tax=Pocillopora meandrina TaxID=46732 RepID=A0AAU9XUX8_9CNID|nr:unnamed protein product [Pocillopora meandrina]
MFLIWLFFYSIWFLGTEGRHSRFISVPSNPTFSHSGNNVTLIWRYHLSQADRANFHRLLFGQWSDGDISTPLMSLSKNGSLVSRSKRIEWIGNKTTAAFRLYRVTAQDGGEYGCMLEFSGAFTVRHTVQLAIVAPPQIKEKGSNIAKVEASVGTSVVLPCHVTGNPQPWILWQRDGQTLQNGTILSDLIIPGVLANMTGLYTCIAGNQAGIDKYQVLLLVTSCGHSGDITHLAQDSLHQDHNHGMDTPASFTPTIVVCVILFSIFGAYFFFRSAGERTKKLRKYDRMPQDEQARSLMGEWSNFADNGEKI